MIRKAVISLFTIAIALATTAQKQVTIPVETRDNALVLQTDAENRLSTIYFGRKLKDSLEYVHIAGEYRTDDNQNGVSNNAYTPAGTWNLMEPAIQVIHGDGNTSTELKYAAHETTRIDANVQLITVTLKDPVYPFEVKLFYKTYAAENILEQWTEIRHQEKKRIVLKKYASANLYLTGRKFFLTHFSGGWAREMQPEETELSAGIKTLDTKLGARADLFQPPSFYVSMDRPATETEGKVLMGTLAWTGNFKFDFEKDTKGRLRIITGINPFASDYSLDAATTFKTPSFITTLSENGKGEASRNLHSWARKYRLRDGNGRRLTLLNNWEATYFDFDETKLVGLFKGAKDLGVDLFLLDDGWFANKYPRNHDSAGLGDWQENRAKLPHGIGYLVKEATAAGIGFGIWVEPEMVNPKSELYEKHRDWVLRQPERPEHYYRNQLVLDLANPEVQDFVFGILDTLLTKNPKLAYIKWDCNAVIYDAHSIYLSRHKLPQTHIYVEYVRGLYKVLERVRQKYPVIPMMLCSGGGGRVDYEALKYFTEYWPSDNTDPLERVFIQWGNSYFFPSIASCNHVTNSGNQPLKYKIDVAMMGKPGFDIVVAHLPAEDLAFAKQSLKTYDSISNLVWHGDLFRLIDPHENNIASLLYASPDKSRAVMFNYLTNFRTLLAPTIDPVRLNGLDPARSYSIREINRYPGNTGGGLGKKATYSGDYLMRVGINPVVTAKRSSVILLIEEVK